MKKSTQSALAAGLLLATLAHLLFWGYRYLHTDPAERSWTLLLGPARSIGGE
ncbi:MAG: hypothetical protein SOR40_09480 [Rothia sp. (in: high G+C Gram-positive bacteria)]|nr:hypothetical protein [Rothia sp. (in: high G+C Gram-positive bacteria)]